jgi:tRNA threonylcarbamoyladenosine biosynthesis protein TsaE
MSDAGGASRRIAGYHRCAGVEQTEMLAARLGEAMSAGDWVVLEGPLGAGKTAFVRGLARGLGIDPRLVHSPTYTLVSEYAGRVALAHVDLYRVADARELEELGLEELVERGIAVAVEWGERLPAGTAPAAWRIEIDPVSETERRVRITRAGGGGAASPPGSSALPW